MNIFGKSNEKEFVSLYQNNMCHVEGESFTLYERRYRQFGGCHAFAGSGVRYLWSYLPTV